MYNGETGDLIFKSPVPGSRRITRQKLREVLSEGLDIQWGRKVVRLDTESDPEKVNVTLEGQGGMEEEVWTDYVLGTDGAGSKVREILFSNQEKGVEKAKAMRSGFMIGTCIVDYQDEEVVKKVLEKHPVTAMVMSRGAVGGFGGMSPPRLPTQDGERKLEQDRLRLYHENLAAANTSPHSPIHHRHPALPTPPHNLLDQSLERLPLLHPEHPPQGPRRRPLPQTILARPLTRFPVLHRLHARRRRAHESLHRRNGHLDCSTV